MPDVFISYSRRDTEFVGELRTRLEACDYETWVDETDIDPSVDWREEIHDGIATSDALVVVVSPTTPRRRCVGRKQPSPP